MEAAEAVAAAAAVSSGHKGSPDCGLSSDAVAAEMQQSIAEAAIGLGAAFVPQI